jgi:hypothetical protein
VPVKPPQIALKRTNNGIRRASTAFIVPLLPPLRSWTGIPKDCCHHSQDEPLKTRDCSPRRALRAIATAAAKICQQRKTLAIAGAVAILPRVSGP